MITKHIANETQMLKFGKQLAACLTDGSLLYLQGDLGAGKTTLVRGLLRGFGYQGIVKSPTYTLVESYQINQHIIHHFDLYRLADPEELEYLGFRDYLTDQAICLIEWPERAGHWLPEEGLLCLISIPKSGVGRELTLRANTASDISIINGLSNLK